MLQKSILLYGKEKAEELNSKIQELVGVTKKIIESIGGSSYWSEKDIYLITYPDSFKKNGLTGLASLESFLDSRLRGVMSGVHILPFFPYSSDRGFSVIDYYKVKEEFGSWDDISNIAKSQKVMADLVLNHVSTRNVWFQKFLAGDPKYQDYFIWFEKDKIPQEDIKKVFRPRATPLLTPFQTAKGERWVWTTFSVEGTTDQVDLNYKNPEVLLEIIKAILFFLTKGIRVLRLDAIPFIWKELGTDCKSLPQVHTIVQIIRSILDEVCPEAFILTQASLDFEDNIFYFGQDQKEAQMIYNFALPPLVLNAFYTANNQHLNKLVHEVNKVPEVYKGDCTFYNILAVHDGIGTRGGTKFLSNAEVQMNCDKVLENGGELGYRSNPDGAKSVSELDTTWWSALNKEDAEPFEIKLKKFITSHAIAMAISGIPVIYYLSLIGAKNDHEFYKKTGVKRDLNRSNLDLKTLDLRLSKSESKESRVFKSMIELINKRKKIRSFHPNAKQKVLELDPRVFAIERSEGIETVLALHNLSKEKVVIKYLGRNFVLEGYDYVWEKLQ